MTILAIDASTKSSGVSIFTNGELKYYDCYTASSTDLIKRIKKIVENISNLLEKYKPDKVILEEVRPDNSLMNLKTTKALNWLQAAIAFAVYDYNPKVSIEYLYPSEWRKKCNIHTGRGIKREELKKADIAFVKNKFNLDVNDDIADAICIGYSYFQQEKKEKEINW